MPKVSVIIPAFYSSQTIDSCLRSLERQTFQDFEVILVDSTPNDTNIFAQTRPFSFVKVHHHDQRLLPHEARNLGVELAHGGILVFTDPDCYGRPDWLERLVAAHQSGHSVVGGAVDTLPGYWNSAVHITKYGWWLPGGKPGARAEIPTANASYSREVWNQVGPFIGNRFAGDSELSWRIKETALHIWFEPRAVVTHDHITTVQEFLRERFQRGRDFGVTRIESFHWTRQRCGLHLLLLPVLPWVMVIRALGYAVAGGYLGSFLSTLAVQLAGYSAWCLGEAITNWEKLWDG